MIQPRKIAAIDMALLGPMLIQIEFAVGVLLSTGLGAWVVWRARSVPQMIFGLYLISIGLNYLPLLLYAIHFGSRERARADLRFELNDKGRAMAKLSPAVTLSVASPGDANRGPRRALA